MGVHHAADTDFEYCFNHSDWLVVVFMQQIQTGSNLVNGYICAADTDCEQCFNHSDWLMPAIAAIDTDFEQCLSHLVMC